MNTIKSNTIAILALGTICFLSACGAKQQTGPVSTKKKTAVSAPTTETGAAAVVKKVYEDAINGNCSDIPPNLTEEFKKAVGNSKDSLEALCDTFTDSKKITAVEIRGEQFTGDTAKIKVALTRKDGKVEQKDEIVKNLAGKWVMDS
ncbi:MAG TPA: hypothetical protein VK612_00390 [Pyrinomonadaceae bacterium]|nr:hypothetical protein [Pyrinomonadaceae bacterium]